MSKIKSSNIYEAFKRRGIQLIDLKVSNTSLPFFDQLKQDPTYGLPLHIALQNGDVDKVLEITKTVESMRALGKSSGAGTVGAIYAIPQMLTPSVYTPPSVYGAPYQQSPSILTPSPAQPQPQKSSIEKARELKTMLDEGFITKEEYEKPREKQTCL